MLHYFLESKLNKKKSKQQLQKQWRFLLLQKQLYMLFTYSAFKIR